MQERVFITLTGVFEEDPEDATQGRTVRWYWRKIAMVDGEAKIESGEIYDSDVLAALETLE